MRPPHPSPHPCATPVASIQPYSTKFQLGSAPFLEPDPNSWRNPNNIQPKLRDCELQCLEMPTCRYGTYITSGSRRGECWLAANTTTTLSPCNVECQSFVKLLHHHKSVGMPVQPAHSAGEWAAHLISPRARTSPHPHPHPSLPWLSCLSAMPCNQNQCTAEIKRAEELLKKAMAQQLTKEAVVRAEQRIQSDEDKLVSVLHHAQKAHLAGSSRCPLGRFSALVFDGHSTTASGFKSRCEVCPPGKFASGELKFCVACAAGTYQRYSGSVVCVNCPSGMYQPSEGQSGCTACPAGKWQHNQGKSFCGRGTNGMLASSMPDARLTQLLCCSLLAPQDCKDAQCPFVVPHCTKANEIPKLQKYWRACCFDSASDCAAGEAGAWCAWWPTFATNSPRALLQSYHCVCVQRFPGGKACMDSFRGQFADQCEVVRGTVLIH